MDKSLLTTFPYRQNPEGLYFPIIPIRIFHKPILINSTALIDSGATISVFRPDVASDLNLKIETGKEIFLGGVGGRIKGYLHKLKIEVSGKNFVSPIVFSYEYFVSFNLLGRQAFFEKFRVCFDEKSKKIILE